MFSSGRKIFFGLCILTVLVVAVRLLQKKPVAPAAATASETSHSVEATAPARASRPVRTHTEAPEADRADSEIVSPAEQARMERMAENILKPQMELDAEAAAKVRANWVDRFHREKDPLLREEIITEMVQLDDGLTLQAMTELLAHESHPGVREQIVLILGYMRSSVPEIKTVSTALMNAFQQSNNPEDRERILRVVSNLPTAESVEFMQNAFTSPEASAQDRYNAAEGLFKLTSRVSVGEELVRTVVERLKKDAQFGATKQERLLAAKALAAPGQDNKVFLAGLMTTETDSEMRQFLELAAEKYPTH